MNGVRMKDVASRRVMYITLTAETILNLLGDWVRHDCFKLPSLEGIPEGCRFISVHWDWLSRTFCVMLEHESFEEVPEGALIPVMPSSAEFTFTTQAREPWHRTFKIAAVMGDVWQEMSTGTIAAPIQPVQRETPRGMEGANICGMSANELATEMAAQQEPTSMPPEPHQATTKNVPQKGASPQRPYWLPEE